MSSRKLFKKNYIFYLRAIATFPKYQKTLFLIFQGIFGRFVTKHHVALQRKSRWERDKGVPPGCFCANSYLLTIKHLIPAFMKASKIWNITWRNLKRYRIRVVQYMFVAILEWLLQTYFFPMLVYWLTYLSAYLAAYFFAQ
ncbi:hypothetical protein ASG33_01040 [Dyadobacter sp. Leaf189]|nr:hypothetical protein ASG33_01040 [Dyadobacter sp. Leaf189]